MALNPTAYFPARPADVNCTSCPYVAFIARNKVVCVRGYTPPKSAYGTPSAWPSTDFVDAEAGGDVTPFCGEHPCFVEQRAILAERARMTTQV